jgi:membrane protein DedA with SNARE-associated domain
VDAHAVIAFLHSWGYPAFTLLLTATGFGFPVPEDLLLLAGGYLIGGSVFNWPMAAPAAWIGVMGSDSILWWLGSRMRTHRHLRRWMQPRHGHRPGWIARWVLHYGDASVFVARLIPGTRVIVFVGSGLRGMPLRRFLAYDALAAAVWVPLVLFLGAQIGEEVGGVDVLLARISSFTHWMLLVALIALAATTLLLHRRAIPPANDPDDTVF